MSGLDVTYLILFGICVILSAFFCSSETAFISLQRYRLEHLLATKVKGASLVASMLDKPERFFSVVLLGTNFVNTAAAALGTILAIRMLGDKTGALVATIVTTIILLVFSETTPKTIAAHHSEKVSLLFASPLKFMEWLLTPLVNGLSWLSTRFADIFGRQGPPRSPVSEEEIRTMISVGEKDGAVEGGAAKMLHKVFEFGDRPASEVMVPRLEMVAIEKGSKISDFMKLYDESLMSRYPVYKENTDNIIGVLSIKDVLMGLAKGLVDNDSLIDELVRTAYFVPETKPINELLVEMREKNHRIAMVVDEYGGTAGIVSLNRLVEEIVGPLGDELSGVEKDYEVIDERNFQVTGSMRIDEANEAMGLDLPEGEDYETMAGLILKLLGRIPKRGDSLRYRGLKMMITHMQGMKIEEILITREKRKQEQGAETKSQVQP